MRFKIDEQSTLEFEYKKLLGRGRTSEVHLAVCTENPDLKVAIKRHRSDHKHMDEWQQHVEREISVLRDLNTAESADWSLETTLRNRITSAENSRDSRSIVQLLSIFDIDGVPALALEVAPPSIIEQTLDHYDLVDAMFQIAQVTELAHSHGMALTDIAPKSKASRIRWDHDLKQIKVIDWNITRETEDYRRRDLIFLGRIFFQLLTGYPTWEKAEPPVDYLPDRYNTYALDITGATIDDWIDVEIAIRDVIERLMYQDISDAINSSEMLVSAMTTLKELSDLAKRIVNGSSQATNELETMLRDVSNSRSLQLREIATIGDYFLRVAPKNRTENYEPQILSAGNLLRTAYLNSINQTIEYFNQARYGDAVAELENARSRFISNHQLTNAANYRYIVASIGEELQRNNALPNADIKELIDTLQDMVVGLESRLWDTRKAEILRDDIRTKYDSNIVNMPDMQALFQDIDASQQYREQIKRINESQRQALIDDESWTTQEAQRIAQYDSVIIPALQSIAKQSLIEKRIDAYIERIQQNILTDQQDLRTVEKFLGELRDGATNIDIEQLLEDATQKRPYAPIRISRKLLPKDQSELSSDANASQAIRRYQTFRQKWDDIMQTSLEVEDKLERLSALVDENQDVIITFREKLPTVTIPGKNNQRKTVYRDLEDLTQFVKAVNFVYDELGAIGINRIPNINKIQQNWVYVTNVQDEDLKQFVSSIQANLASHTNDRAQAKQIPPELSMLVYEILDVPIPSSVMQIGQEIQLQSYIRTTLNQAKQLLTDADAVGTIISELSQRKVWGNDELNESLDQLTHKLEQLKAALTSRTVVRQIRTLYQISKRKITSDNPVIDELSNAIDEAVESLINTRIKHIEKALDKAKTSKPMDREEEVLVHDAQRVLDTLRHSNRLQERRWHHVQNSQAFLLREYTQTIEKATTSFNSYNYSESRKHIDRAFYLANLFDKPSDKRLSEELRTAEDMVQQLGSHFTITRDVETVHLEDIEKFIQNEISFWENLHETIQSLESQPSDDPDATVDMSFDPQSLDNLIDALTKALTVTETMHRIRQAVEHLRDLEQTIDSHHLDLLKPLSSRLREILLYRYTQTLNHNITELEQIASGSRVISNESVIKRVSEGYELVKMNKTLQILDDTDINQRQRQLQNNSYTALKNMKLKNQDERQALAKFVDNLLTEQDIRSRDFQAVLLRLADDPNSYAYLIEQVHNHKLPSINANNSRNMRSVFIVVSVISIMVVVIGVYVSQNPTLLDELIR